MISGKVTCAPDKIEPMQGENQTNIGKLGKIKNSTLNGGGWALAAILDPEFYIWT